MNEKLLAKYIKEKILVKNFERYFDILQNQNNEPFQNNSWHKIQLLYNSIDENNKEHLKECIKMVMVETISELLAFVDGIATFDEQEYLFELFYNGKKISGNIQKYLFMDLEDNGFKMF